MIHWSYYGEQYRREKARANRAEQRVATLEAAIKIKGGNEHAPTQDAYDAACRAINEQRARADRAEAALAAQIEADAGIADECERQNGPLSKRGSDPYVQGLSSAGQAIAAAIRAQPHDRTALDRMLAEAKAEALQGPWSDKPDDLTDAVHKAHPAFTKKYDTYAYALELVSNRHSKGALVALVNYLLQQSDEAREKALREAAEILDDEGWLGMSKHRILALIEKPQCV